MFEQFTAWHSLPSMDSSLQKFTLFEREDNFPCHHLCTRIPKRYFCLHFFVSIENSLAFLMKQRVKLLPITSHEEGTTRKFLDITKKTQDNHEHQNSSSLYSQEMP